MHRPERCRISDRNSGPMWGLFRSIQGRPKESDAFKDIRKPIRRNSLHKGVASRVFIQKDATELRDIIEDFEQYGRGEYSEEELTDICKDSIILRDRHMLNNLENDVCVIRSVRRSKWKPQKEGLALTSQTHFYDWEIEPDVTSPCI